MKSKAVALLLLTRYVALSRAGMPLEWMLYLGLPITGPACCLPCVSSTWAPGGAPRRAAPCRTVAAPTLARPRYRCRSRRRPSASDGSRKLHARGAISETEHSAQRLRIIANM